jgi:hypothetical protein
MGGLQRRFLFRPSGGKEGMQSRPTQWEEWTILNASDSQMVRREYYESKVKRGKAVPVTGREGP